MSKKIEDMKCRQCGYAHAIGSKCPPDNSPAENEQLGIAWWNALTRQERLTVLIQAGNHKHDPSVADAWQMWREGLVSTEKPNEKGQR